MKRARSFLLITMTLILLTGVLALPASAKELEVCRICGGSGAYHCPSCGNTGSVPCDGCGGTGRWICPGEEGKGKCDNGWYVCPSCNGDGKARPIPADGNAGPCGNCGGSGRKACWSCHGTGGGECDRCHGTGRAPCMDGNCQKVRANGYKCPKCSGSGYVLVGNPMPPDSANDGVRNVPQKGDHIITNDKTWAYTVYTGSGSSGGSQPNPVVGGGSGAVSQAPEPGSSAPAVELPKDRDSSFDVFSATEGDPSVRVEPQDMAPEDRSAYAALSEEDLAAQLTALTRATPTLRPGEASEALSALLDAVVAHNGLPDRAEGRLYPIGCDEEVELDFPVQIVLPVAEGELNGGKPLRLYRYKKDGAVEEIGPAETWTREDGTVSSVRMTVRGLSEFFLAAEDVDIPLPEDDMRPAVGVEEETGGFPWHFAGTLTAAALLIAMAVLLIGIVVLTVLLYRRRRKLVEERARQHAQRYPRRYR